MKNDYFALGQWNVECDVCGRKIKSSSARKRWDGYWVCDADWEPRQPLDFIRGVKDDQSVPFSRPPNDLYTPIPVKTSNYALATTDQTVQVDATSGALIMSLPASPTAMEQHTITKVDATNNSVTISGNGKLFCVSGVATNVLTKPNSSLLVQYSGSCWNILGVI